MFVVLRGGIASKFASTGVSKELCKILPQKNVIKIQAAGLTRAAFRDENEVPLIKPFPYHEKPYSVMNMLLDTHKCRVHKHSKIIVIDGPPASGKNELAKQLAKEFDFLYLPQPNFDDLLVTHWGFDARTLDHKLPKSVQSWDIERFLQNPTDINTAAMQNYMLMMRQDRWMWALGHIFCTGQGVVTVRSPWTDQVFAKAMAQNKFISAGALEAHTDLCLASLHFYLKPHLIIYLDVPVEKTLQNIKNRGRKEEQNSPVITEKYLSNLEENYKRDYLSKISEHSLMLIYDWSQGGDTEVVVEDIENLNFDDYDELDVKLQDWRFTGGWIWKVHTKHYTYDRDQYLHNLDIMRTDVPEICASGNDIEVWDDVWAEVKDSEYDPKFHPYKGDSIKDIMMRTRPYLRPDHVTPLMKKYYERKARLDGKK
ncbi:hypothetical protein TKK_0006288 [Trichogramma kaykai]|uniref:NADH dehydrogenase [ubiquinone] 1 alpha subcomplex subunit 10, mitochondrial n=1 Tax=Trichogramma kaykai TaxID=54128 RepID=A0ABD2XF21_9HYME